MKNHPVYVNLLKPLEEFYGSMAVPKGGNAKLIFQKWIDHLGMFPESTLKGAFEQVILTNIYPRWPTLAEVYGICKDLRPTPPISNYRIV